MSSDENGCKLQVMLAEYTELKAEIRSRSKAQNNILQIHITALTAIIGFVAYQAINGNTQSSIPFSILFLLISLESSIFGIWYFDHAITIFEIGLYIQNKIEKRIETEFDHSGIMKWESGYNNNEFVYGSLIRNCISQVIVFITFVGPILISFFLLTFYYIWVQEISITFESLVIMVFIISDVFLFLLLLAVMIYCIYKPHESKMKQNSK